MANVFSALAQRAQRRKVYANLMRLDDHLLADIGLTRSEVHQMMSGRRKVAAAHE